jgi:hypothetical protein
LTLTNELFAKTERTCPELNHLNYINAIVISILEDLCSSLISLVFVTGKR